MVRGEEGIFMTGASAACWDERVIPLCTVLYDAGMSMAWETCILLDCIVSDYQHGVVLQHKIRGMDVLKDHDR